MSTDDYVMRRCRAFRWDGLQCEGESSEATYHVEEHWAHPLTGRGLVYWSDDEAISKQMWLDEGVRGPIPPVPASERQVGGDHYRKFKIQPWDVVDEYELSFYAGSALKYLLRAGNKGAALEDLRKCRHYLDKLIEIEEGKTNE